MKKNIYKHYFLMIFMVSQLKKNGFKKYLIMAKSWKLEVNPVK